jgi:predicted ABC-class ATPase
MARTREQTRTAAELRGILERIDSRGYKAYAEIVGAWEYDDFVLLVDHVQGDPFATPTRVRALVTAGVVALDPAVYRTRPRALGTAAHLARTFAREARGASRARGTGKSGILRMEHTRQKVLEQTAVFVESDGSVEARFTVGLPARGRRIAGREAVELLLDSVPAVVRASVLASAHDPAEIERSAATNEDAMALRDLLSEHGLIAFVADGARLPRRSGIDDRPLEDDPVVPFRSPESMRVAVDLPNAGRVTGMGIEPGVTLIVGGGFHGKSTLLRALEQGVYDHRPGDGREFVVTHADAVKIRAEDGRSVSGVDISGFIDGLPLGRDTTAFTTPNASGSTSQAAAIVEAVEAGARMLLIDEDTSATNFMIRDRRMQELIPRQGEPITPFVDRVRELHDGAGVSSVLVIGGSGDYLDVADRVVRMADYLPTDVTSGARAVVQRLPTGREVQVRAPLPRPATRRVDAASVSARRGRRERYVRVPDDRTLLFGEETIDLVALEQLALPAQTRAIGRALAILGERVLSDVGSLPEALDAIDALLARDGLDALDDWKLGDLAAFRRFELAATLNRLRTLRVE